LGILNRPAKDGSLGYAFYRKIDILKFSKGTGMILDQPKPSDSRYLSLFQEVTRLITSTLNVAKVLETIAAKIPDVIAVDAATIRLLDPTGEKLLLLAAHGLSQEYLGRGPVDTEKSVMAALAGSPVSIYDAASDPRINVFSGGPQRRCEEHSGRPHTDSRQHQRCAQAAYQRTPAV
jgi:hypothetical protein